MLCLISKEMLVKREIFENQYNLSEVLKVIPDVKIIMQLELIIYPQRLIEMITL